MIRVFWLERTSLLLVAESGAFAGFDFQRIDEEPLEMLTRRLRDIADALDRAGRGLEPTEPRTLAGKESPR
jgi:hypothetical protein